jgi:hypothetical protein
MRGIAIVVMLAAGCAQQSEAERYVGWMQVDGVEVGGDDVVIEFRRSDGLVVADGCVYPVTPDGLGAWRGERESAECYGRTVSASGLTEYVPASAGVVGHPLTFGALFTSESGGGSVVFEGRPE